MNDELIRAENLSLSKEMAANRIFVLDEIINITQNVLENTEEVSTNTTSVPEETPMEIARKYKKYYEEYSHTQTGLCSYHC